MQRYNNKSEAKIDDRIIIDNRLNVTEVFPPVMFVGDVVKVDDDGDNITVSVSFRGADPIEISIPYYLAL